MKGLKTDVVFFTPEKCLYIHFVLQVSQTLSFGQSYHLQRSDGAKEAGAKVRVVLDVVATVVRAIRRTFGRRAVRVVEHPQRNRRNTASSTATHNCTTMRPFPRFGVETLLSHKCYSCFLLNLQIFFSYFSNWVLFCTKSCKVFAILSLSDVIILFAGTRQFTLISGSSYRIPNSDSLL